MSTLKMMETDLRNLTKRLELYENQAAEGNANEFTIKQIQYYQAEASKVRDVILDSFSIEDATLEAPNASPQLHGTAGTRSPSNDTGY